MIIYFFLFQSYDFKGEEKEADYVQPFRQGALPQHNYLVYLTLFSLPLTFENYHLIVCPQYQSFSCLMPRSFIIHLNKRKKSNPN